MRFSIALRSVSAWLTTIFPFPMRPRRGLRKTGSPRATPTCARATENGRRNLAPREEKPPKLVKTGSQRQVGADPFHMPTELADGLGVESLPRSYGPDSPLSRKAAIGFL